MGVTTDPMIVLITGVMAAGKSSVAQALAQRQDPSVHLRGDVFRKMIVRGREDIASPITEEALSQLKLRYRLAVDTAEVYRAAGFNVIYQDVVLGPMLSEVLRMFRSDVKTVVLCPTPDVVALREQERDKVGYGGVSIDDLQVALQQTPPVGFWLDSSNLSVAETVDAIEDHLRSIRP